MPTPARSEFVRVQKSLLWSVTTTSIATTYPPKGIETVQHTRETSRGAREDTDYNTMRDKFPYQFRERVPDAPLEAVAFKRRRAVFYY
jgi:hypothetical protein